MVEDISNFELSKAECAKLVEYRDKKRLAQLAALKNPFAAKMHQAFGVPMSGAKNGSPAYNFLISGIVVLICVVASVALFLFLNQSAFSGSNAQSSISNTPLPQEGGSSAGEVSKDSKDGIPNVNVPSTKLSNAVFRDLLKFFDASNLESIKVTDKVPKDVALYLTKILSFSDTSAGEVSVKLMYTESEVSSSTISNVAAIIFEAVSDANPELKRIIVTSSDGIISAVYPS